MKYIVLTNVYQEEDNNIPALSQFIRTVDIETDEISKYEKNIEQAAFDEFTCNEVTVNFIPLEDTIDDDVLINEEY